MCAAETRRTRGPKEASTCFLAAATAFRVPRPPHSTAGGSTGAGVLEKSGRQQGCALIASHRDGRSFFFYSSHPVCVILTVRHPANASSGQRIIRPICVIRPTSHPANTSSGPILLPTCVIRPIPVIRPTHHPAYTCHPAYAYFPAKKNARRVGKTRRRRRRRRKLVRMQRGRLPCSP